MWFNHRLTTACWRADVSAGDKLCTYMWKYVLWQSYMECLRASLYFTLCNWSRTRRREFLTYDCKTGTPTVDNFSCLLFVAQNRLALYLTDARIMLARLSGFLPAVIADRGYDDRTRARGTATRTRQASTLTNYTCSRRLSSLSSSNAFDAFYSDKLLLFSISASQPNDAVRSTIVTRYPL